jgi:hypothetical protein
VTDFLPLVLDPEDAARSHERVLEIARILKDYDRHRQVNEHCPERPSVGAAR